MDPRECAKCRANFCMDCVKDQQAQGVSKCAGCKMSLEVIQAHPIVKKKLQSLKISCENSSKGCTEKVSYALIDDHRFSCLFATIRCGHFGCGEEMLRKDLEEHSKTCKFRKEKCPKCETIFSDSD